MKTFVISAIVGLVIYFIATRFVLDPGFFHQESDYEWSWSNAKRVTVMSGVIALYSGLLGLMFTAFFKGMAEK